MESMISFAVAVGFLLWVSAMAKKKQAERRKNPAGRTGTVRQPVRQQPTGNASRTIVSTAEARPKRRVSEEEVQARLKEYRERKQAEQNRDMDNWKRSAFSRKESAAPADPAGSLFRTDAGLQDDRHDWLAEQLAEERKAYRNVSAMFQMKMSHMQNCAAENARLEHTLHCDARELAEDSRAH